MLLVLSLEPQLVVEPLWKGLLVPVPQVRKGAVQNIGLPVVVLMSHYPTSRLSRVSSRAMKVESLPDTLVSGSQGDKGVGQVWVFEFGNELDSTLLVVKGLTFPNTRMDEPSTH